MDELVKKVAALGLPREASTMNLSRLMVSLLSKEETNATHCHESRRSGKTNRRFRSDIAQTVGMLHEQDLHNISIWRVRQTVAVQL